VLDPPEPDAMPFDLAMVIGAPQIPGIANNERVDIWSKSHRHSIARNGCRFGRVASHNLHSEAYGSNFSREIFSLLSEKHGQKIVRILDETGSKQFLKKREHFCPAAKDCDK